MDDIGLCVGNTVIVVKTFCLLPINRDFYVLFKQWDRNPSHITCKSRLPYLLSGMKCLRKSGTAFVIVNAFLKLTQRYVTCAAFNNTFPAVLIKKLSSERLCCGGLLGRVWKCSWLILKQHLNREKLRRPKNRWSSGREFSWMPPTFEPRVRVWLTVIFRCHQHGETDNF